MRSSRLKLHNLIPILSPQLSSISRRFFRANYTRRTLQCGQFWLRSAVSEAAGRRVTGNRLSGGCGQDCPPILLNAAKSARAEPFQLGRDAHAQAGAPGAAAMPQDTLAQLYASAQKT